MTAAAKLATYEDLLRLPEDARAEVLAGEIVTQPAPRPRHSKVQRALGRFLGGPFDDDDGFGGPGGWWNFLEVDVQLGPHDVVRPELSAWRRERLVEPDTRPITIVPDWVCEISSPSTARLDRVVKRRLYAKHGVKHYWIVDPIARALEALELKDGSWSQRGVYGDDETVRIPPFDAVELPIGRLCLPPDKTAPSDD